MGRALPALAVAAVIAVGVTCAVASLQQDFAAYDAAGAARRAGLDPYVNQGVAGRPSRAWDGVAVFRHSRFLYPPLVADLFRGAAAVPYLAAKAAFTLLAIAAWLAVAGLLPSNRPVFLVAGALFFPLWRHLERGQIDLLLLLLLAIAWRFRGRAWPAGVALGAAVAIKPALAGVALVVAALGQVRVAIAAGAALLLLAGVTIAVDGAPRLREYLTQVAPRASLYGEGGTESMLLADDARPDDAGDGVTVRDGRAYRTALWDVPAAASLPRLLAPDAPTRLTAWLPFALGFALLVGCARRCAAVGGRADGLFWGAAVACVVTSPAGWVMGLVLALPLAPALVEVRVAAAWPRSLSAAAAAGWLGAALPWPVAGVATLGGTLLVVVAAATAVRTPQPVHA